MITLDAILARAHAALAASAALDAWCKANLSKSPLIGNGNDPKSEPELRDCPAVALWPLSDDLSGSMAEMSITLEVRLNDPRTETPVIPGALSRTVVYRWTRLLTQFLQQCQNVINAEFAPLGIRPTNFTTAYETAALYPVVLATRNLKYQLPRLLIENTTI